MEIFLELFGRTLLTVASALGGLMVIPVYVWSIVLAYGFGGILGAVLTLAVPVISQVVLAVIVYRVAGTWLNSYCLALTAAASLFALALLGSFLESFGEKRREKRELERLVKIGESPENLFRKG